MSFLYICWYINSEEKLYLLPSRKGCREFSSLALSAQGSLCDVQERVRIKLPSPYEAGQETLNLMRSLCHTGWLITHPQQNLVGLVASGN